MFFWKRYKSPGGRYTEFSYNILTSGYHALIAGTTGSGKSTLVNSIIFTRCALDVNFCDLYLIDPKRVELSRYKGLPFVQGFASDNNDIIALLDEVIEVMQKRFKRMERKGLQLSDEKPICLIIDEIADLMVTCKKQVLPRLQRIAQLGRAARITIIMCTQAPARKIIPAELILNINYRIALHCANGIESKQIIDDTGAELLPAYGVALVKNPKRQLHKQQVLLIPEQEIQQRIDFWLKQR